MSRVAKKPITLPAGVSIAHKDAVFVIKGPKGTLELKVPSGLAFAESGASITLADSGGSPVALVGTYRALVQNAVTGVSQGYERKLELFGVGYRASVDGGKLNLTLGFSHPVSYSPPVGVSITAPTQTEIVISGADRQKVGQVAANIRAFRPPEPYKGKGVRFAGEKITLKEAKKA